MSEKHQLASMAPTYPSPVTWQVTSWLYFLIGLKQETWTCESSVESDVFNDAHLHYLVALSELQRCEDHLLYHIKNFKSQQELY